MKRFQKFLYSLHPFVLSSIASVLTVAQVVLAFFLHGRNSEALQWAGWICVWASGIFGILPIIAFRRKGGVPKGESYMKTTVLVDTGIYAIVRHPQGGTAWLLIKPGRHVDCVALDQHDSRPGFNGFGLRRYLQSRPILHREIRRYVQALYAKGTKGEFLGWDHSASTM